MAELIDMERLIERLEAAHDKADSYGAIRYHKGEFNAEIATALWGERRASGSVEGPQTLVWWNDGMGRSVAPDFVGSLDAALTLVPRGWGFKADCGLGHGHSFTVGHVGSDKLYDQPEGWGKGATPPLALCIAALRARLSAPSLPETPE